jgi:TldD protein
MNSRAVKQPIELASVDGYPDGRWSTPIRRDPFRVRIDEKADLLIAANREALKVDGVRFVRSFMQFERTQSTFASTDGSIVEQTVYRTHPSMTVTAVASDMSALASRASFEVAPLGQGYEHVFEADLIGRAQQWGEEAVEKLSAPSVMPGSYDLVVDPTNLYRTVHESIGCPTGLDRALGRDANDGGMSFLAPPVDTLNKVRYGPEFMNVVGDRTQRSALATSGWDDEGVPADSWPIIRDGIFVDYQTTRGNAAEIASITNITRSHGCSFAESWDGVQLQGMPNVSLLPGEDDTTIDDLVVATDGGILLKGSGFYSIDEQGYRFRSGGQLFYEIRNGRVMGMLRDVAYRSSTLEFWNSMDMIGGTRSYFLGGTMGDGEGQPVRTNAVSHGCPAARFSQVNVINTSA